MSRTPQLDASPPGVQPERIGFWAPAIIVAFIAATLAGTYYVRRLILEKTLANAAAIGDEEGIRSLVDSWPSPVNGRLYAVYSHAPMRSTVLHWAIERGRYDLADWLIDHGADVGAMCNFVGAPGGPADGFFFIPGKAEGPGTPLDYAVECGRTGLVRHLLDHGANIEGGCWTTPLSAAAELGNIEIMTLLLDRGAAVNRAASADTSTPITAAAARGRTEAVRLLLDRGAAINALDGAGWTPLHYAAFHGHTDLAALLVSRGADPAIRSTMGETALMLAEKKQSAAIAEILRKPGEKE